MPLKPLKLLLFAATATVSLGKAWAGQHRCEQLIAAPFVAMELSGGRFLHQRDPTLVQKASRVYPAQSGSLTQPDEKIALWLRYLGESYFDQDQERLARIKAYYHRQFVLEPNEVPDSYFKLLAQIARERGEGTVELSDSEKAEKARLAVEDQRESLDAWLDYFLSQDSSSYPMWAKYWAFTRVVKLTRFDPETKEFARRSRDSVAPYPELNREALSYVMEAIQKSVYKRSLDDFPDQGFVALLKDANFGKLYARALVTATATAQDHRTTDGKWVKYIQRSDAAALVESLKGRNTGWCTANTATAQHQLNDGDLYVFYSLDAQGEPKVPRLAIRMRGIDIAEVRGVAKGQNLDASIAESSVLEDKLKEFGPKGEAYKKKLTHMKRLSELELKLTLGHEPEIDDLRFLYEIDEPIFGFGYNRDPRIEELIKSRSDIKQDLARAFNGAVNPDEISLTKEEALKPGIKFHYGNLDLRSLTSTDGLSFPQAISGNLNLSGVPLADGLRLPRSIGGYLNLHGLTSAEGLTLPQSIGTYLNLPSLTSAEGLRFPEFIGGDLNLGGLTSAEGLTLPPRIGGDLNLGGLTSAEGLTLPPHVGGDLNLDGFTSARGLRLPPFIGGLALGALTSAEGLTLPRFIGGSLDLRGLTSAKGLRLPLSIGKDLNLRRLTSTEGLNLPNSIGGHLNLRALSSAEGLTLPQSIGGYLNLSSLTWAEGLRLPKTIGQHLYLYGLSSAKELILPKSIGGGLYLDNYKSAEGLTLPPRIGGDLNLGGLTSARGLRFPRFIGGRLDLRGLISAEGASPPQSIGGNLLIRESLREAFMSGGIHAE